MDTSGEKLFNKIHALAAGQLESSLTPVQQRELETLLLESGDARRAYVEYFEETACLRWLCLEELSGALEPAKSGPNRGQRRVVRRWVEAYTVLGGVACIFALIAGGWFLNLRSTGAGPPAERLRDVAAVPQRVGESDVMRQPSGQPAEDVRPLVATITGLGAVRWSQATHQATLLSRCAIGDRLRLQDGAIELTFDAGAQVTVFAPADFEITSGTSIRCERGRVTALVGERGKGFVVETPRAKVVDLGTQFGLTVSDVGETEVVVFQGSVDLTYAPPAAAPAAAAAGMPRRRLIQGEALLLNNLGEFQRVVSIQRNDFLTALEGLGRRTSEPVIADVRDNIRTAEGVNTYQIVRGGLDEDALSFVDRSHQWNGLTRAGLPAFLLGADYIMPFNDDKFAGDLELKLRLLRPARVYVFLDNNMEVPAWLRDEFEDTGVDIGLDGAKTEWHQGHSLGVGPGRSVDFPFSVWRRDVKRAGTITLGGVNAPQVGTRSSGFNMYGIAAAATD